MPEPLCPLNPSLFYLSKNKGKARKVNLKKEWKDLLYANNCRNHMTLLCLKTQKNLEKPY